MYSKQSGGMEVSLFVEGGASYSGVVSIGEHARVQYAGGTPFIVGAEGD